MLSRFLMGLTNPVRRFLLSYESKTFDEATEIAAKVKCQRITRSTYETWTLWKVYSSYGRCIRMLVSAASVFVVHSDKA